MKKFNFSFFAICMFFVTAFLNPTFVFAKDLSIGDPAPDVKLMTEEGVEFDLKSRTGKWTILYFYPKAETPGCTKQACAYRDKIEAFRNEGAEVYGISTDSVSDLASFKKHHNLNFTLLSDEKTSVCKAYGTKHSFVSIAKRTTFIINPQLKIASISRDVDPVMDADKIATEIKKLKATGP